MVFGPGEMKRVGRFQTKVRAQKRGVFKDLLRHGKVCEAGKGRAVSAFRRGVSLPEWADEAFERNHLRDSKARARLGRHARAHPRAPNWIMFNKINDEASIEIN